jgi:hypothetical protein
MDQLGNLSVVNNEEDITVVFVEWKKAGHLIPSFGFSPIMFDAFFSKSCLASKFSIL